ncbi:MAG: LysR family transcriptional regulator [Proteobacteria bacterium]|nr:LysR family transcriptional regulator [Pseudomonadota bacterium]MBS0571806.1 LysR family transcriptional regulator [Pseudomonadota bacterium]
MAATGIQALPPLAAIRAFEAAARHGSFTHAADELGMTQAAVSYQIRVLEDRVGMPLFRRRARGVTLTPDGARLAERAGEALEILRQAFAEARRSSDETLVISVLTTFATHVLASRLGRFQIGHPEVTTRLDVDNRLADLQAGEASVAIRYGLGKWPGLKADFLIRTTFTPMIGRAYAERNGVPARPEDLQRLPLIDPDDNGWAKWFEAVGLAAPRPTGAGRLMLGTELLSSQAVLAGQGAGLLTPFYFREMLARGDLIQPFDTVLEDQGSIWLVYPERRRNVPAICAFRDWLLAEMRAMAPSGGRLPAAPPSDGGAGG